jgi:hypothetical protein
MMHHHRGFGVVTFGVFAAMACADSKSQNGPGTPGTGGCSGAACGLGGAGVGGTLIGTGGGAGGAMPGGGMGGIAGTSTGGQPEACTPLKLAQGTSSPDGITALHSPSADAFGDVYGSGIALADGYVYFDYKSELMRVSAMGGAPQSLHAVKDLNVVFFVIGGELVWIEQDPNTMAYGISKVPVTATDSTAPTVVASAIDTPDVYATDAKAVYFSNRDKNIVYRAPLDGSGVTSLTTNAEPLGAVVVGGTYYFLDFSNRLMSVPTSGGTATALVNIQFGGNMAADGSTLYWSDTSDETVNRWAPGDKNPTVLAMFALLEGAGSIAVEKGDVYYTPQGFGCGGIGRVPADGSKVTRIANGFDSPSGIAVDADNVYVVAWNGVFKSHR